ncbi:MAG: XkdX family protein [Thermoactinomyces sp.]
MASRLFTYFLLRWQTDTITEEQLQNAVAKGYITQDEYQTIIETPKYNEVQSLDQTGQA